MEALQIELLDRLDIRMLQQHNQRNKVRGNKTSGEICLFQLLAWLADQNIMMNLVSQTNKESLLAMVSLQEKDMSSWCRQC